VQESDFRAFSQRIAIETTKLIAATKATFTPSAWFAVAMHATARKISSVTTDGK
jgi:hypothetical protein